MVQWYMMVHKLVNFEKKCLEPSGD